MQNEWGTAVDPDLLWRGTFEGKPVYARREMFFLLGMIAEEDVATSWPELFEADMVVVCVKGLMFSDDAMVIVVAKDWSISSTNKLLRKNHWWIDKGLSEMVNRLVEAKPDVAK